jgi:DMSO/TMAO reductase YedYZ molybdopterin-dependent catalytic subunit
MTLALSVVLASAGGRESREPDYGEIDIQSVQSDVEFARVLPEYRIRFSGLISPGRGITFEQIVTQYGDRVITRTVHGMRTDDETIDIEYTGIAVAELLEGQEIGEEVRNVMIYGSDKYSAAVPVEQVLNGDVMLVWKRDGEYLIPGEDGVMKVVQHNGLTRNWVKNPVLFDFIGGFRDLVPLKDRLSEDEVAFVDQQDLFTLQIGPVPDIDVKDWRLEITGLLANPATYSYDDILGMPQETVYATLETISNPPGGRLIGNALWTGVPLSHVLEEVEPEEGALEIIFKCHDGYSTSITMTEARTAGVMLAYRVNGETLAPEHGYPVRLVVPEKYGQKWPKWIKTMEIVNYDYRGYWETRGWSDYAGRDRPDQRFD